MNEFIKIHHTVWAKSCKDMWAAVEGGKASSFRPLMYFFPLKHNP